MLPGTTLLKQRDIQIIECLCTPHSYQAMESSSGISPTHFLAGIQSSACPLQTAWAFANRSSPGRQTSVAHDSAGWGPSVQLNNLICFYCRGGRSFLVFPIWLDSHVKVCYGTKTCALIYNFFLLLHLFHLNSPGHDSVCGFFKVPPGWQLLQWNDPLSVIS